MFLSLKTEKNSLPVLSHAESSLLDRPTRLAERVTLTANVDRRSWQHHGGVAKQQRIDRSKIFLVSGVSSEISGGGPCGVYFLAWR